MSKEISFEENIEKLEKIVAELEKWELNLDDSMKRFEEGIEISKKCNEILENAEKKITILLKDGEDIQETDFKQEWNYINCKQKGSKPNE